MKYLIFTLISFLFVLPLQNVAQQECPAAAKRMLKEAESFRKVKNYEKAINKCNAARNCDPALASDADALIVKIFTDIEGEKKTAVEQKDRANEQERIAKKARDTADVRKQEAEEQTRIAKEARDIAEVRRLQAEEETRKARSLALTAAANSAFYKDENATKSFRYAQYAVQIDSNNYEAKAAFLQTVYQPQNKPLIPFYFSFNHKRVVDFSLSADEKKLFVSSSLPDTNGNAEVYVWDMQTRKLISYSDTAFAASRRVIEINEDTNGNFVFYDWEMLPNEWKKKLREIDREDCERFFLSPDKKMLCGSFENRIAKIWDIESKQSKPKHIIQIYLPKNREEIKDSDFYSDYVEYCYFSKEGTNIFLVSDATAEIWDYEAERRIATLEHGGDRYDANISSDGRYLCTASDNNFIKIWDFQTGRQIFTLGGHTKEVIQANFCTNDKKIISKSEDGTIKIWNLDKSVVTNHIIQDASNIYQSNFIGDNKYIYIYKDSLIAIYSPNTNVPIRTIPVTDSDYYMRIGGFKNKNRLYVYKQDTLTIWDVESPIPKKQIIPHLPYIKNIKLYEDHFLLFITDSCLLIWDINQNKQIDFIRESGLTDGYFSYKDFSISFITNTMQIKEKKNGVAQTIFNLDTLIHHKEKIDAFFSDLGDKIVIEETIEGTTTEVSQAKSEKKLKIWDIKEKRVVSNIQFTYKMGGQIVQTSPDSKLVAFDRDDATITIASTATGTILTNFSIDKEKWINSINFSPDSKQIIVSAVDNEESITKTWIIDPSTLIDIYKDEMDDLSPAEKAKYGIK